RDVQRAVWPELKVGDALGKLGNRDRLRVRVERQRDPSDRAVAERSDVEVPVPDRAAGGVDLLGEIDHWIDEPMRFATRAELRRPPVVAARADQVDLVLFERSVLRLPQVPGGGIDAETERVPVPHRI